jgi:hypothetical protein
MTNTPATPSRNEDERHTGAGRARLIGVSLAVACVVVLGGPPVAGATDHDIPHSAGDPNRVFELVSPSDKVSGVGVGPTYVGPGGAADTGMTAYRGDRFAVQGTLGSMLLNGAFGFANDWAFVDRLGDQQGWISHSPITHPLRNRELTRFITMGSANPSMSKMVWSGNGPVRLFPEMESWPEVGYNAYVGDWLGRWELLDVTDPAQVPEAPLGQVSGSALSVDGRYAVLSGVAHGLAGPGDPAHPAWGDRVAGESVYRFDVSAELTDAFPAAGVASRYTLANTCTGSGIARTRLPVRLVDGRLGEQECPPRLPGRDERLISDRGAGIKINTAGGNGHVPAQAVSADGSRMFFMSPDPALNAQAQSNPGALGCTADIGAATKCPAQLFVRQTGANGQASVRWISRAEDGLFGAQQASLLGPAVFEGASENGDKVFFRTTSPLTVDDPNGSGAPAPAGGVTTGSASPASWDLYMYDLPDGPDGDPSTPDGDPGGGELTRISGGPGGAGDCNNPQGELVGFFPLGGAVAGSLRFVSADGSRAYFTCAAPLNVAGSSDPRRVTVQAGAAASTDFSNLYAYDGSGASPAWRFVARIPRSTSTSGADAASVCASTGTVRGSGLTGSNTFIGFARVPRNCVGGRSDGGFVTFWTPGRLTVDDDVGSGDVYGYDLGSDDLVRLSRPATGAVGGSYPCTTVSPTPVCHGDSGFQDEVNFANPLLGVASDPETTGDRMAFFQSRSRLVLEDGDGAYDVYKWHNGVLSLVSTGASDTNDGALYRGNDVTGRNVFFATRDVLTWQDADTVLDIYVGRLGSKGIPRPAVPVLCDVLAHGCRGGGRALVQTSPASDDPNGGGDASPGRRARIAVGGLGRRAQIRAARSGVIRLRVKTNRAGVVRVLAKVRHRKRARVVGRASKRFRKAGSGVVRLSLSKAARRQLRSGQQLRIAIGARMSGARPRSVSVVLQRAGR